MRANYALKVFLARSFSLIPFFNKLYCNGMKCPTFFPMRGRHSRIANSGGRAPAIR
jgi:hypothetical protein